MNMTTAISANRTASPSLTAMYRRDAAMIDDMLVGLASVLTHRAASCVSDAREWVAITERSWRQYAIQLTAMPAWSANEARSKAAALQPALDGRATNMAGDGHRGPLAMIAAGIATERSQWGLEIAGEVSPSDGNG